MSPQDEKRIFLTYAAVRLFGLAVFLLGVGIAFSNWLRPGGWPMLGGLLAIAGVLDAVLVPPMIRRAMEKQAGEE